MAEKKLATPDVTKAQAVAVVGSIIGVAVAFGAPITEEQSSRLIDLVVVLAPALVVIDGLIRAARARWLGGQR